MDLAIEKAVDKILTYGGWGFLLLFLFIFLMFGDRMLFIPEKFWSLFKNTGRVAFKKYTSSKLSNNVYISTKRLNEANSSILPYRIKVKWVDNETVESFFKNDQIIVKIHNDEDISKSFVLAVSEYIEKGLIPVAKSFLKDCKLVQSINTCAVNKVLANGYNESFWYFQSEVLSCLLENDIEFESTFKDLLIIDRSGLFVTVFLNEISKASNKLIVGYPIDDFDLEIKNLLRYLLTFSKSYRKQLVYDSKYFHFAFGLIASNDYLEQHGEDGYIDKVHNSITRGIQTVYLIAWGRKIRIIKSIVRELLKNDMRIEEINCNYYNHVFDDSSTTRAICAEVIIKQ